MILNTKGNQILGNLSQVNRKKILNLMELSFEKNIEYWFLNKNVLAINENAGSMQIEIHDLFLISILCLFLCA